MLRRSNQPRSRPSGPLGRRARLSAGRDGHDEAAEAVMRVRPGCSIAAVLLLIGMPWSAHAQPRIASLGKGWLLGAVGSIASAPGEVISGNNSIKGSGSSQMLLLTDPAVIKFAPNQS